MTYQKGNLLHRCVVQLYPSVSNKSKNYTSNLLYTIFTKSSKLIIIYVLYFDLMDCSKRRINHYSVGQLSWMTTTANLCTAQLYFIALTIVRTLHHDILACYLRNRMSNSPQGRDWIKRVLLLYRNSEMSSPHLHRHLAIS